MGLDGAMDWAAKHIFFLSFSPVPAHFKPVMCKDTFQSSNFSMQYKILMNVSFADIQFASKVSEQPKRDHSFKKRINNMHVQKGSKLKAKK